MALNYAERSKRDVDCDKQIEKVVTAPNCMLRVREEKEEVGVSERN